MTNSHQFGGAWTEQKLTSIRKYLQAYMSIMQGNKNARLFFTTYYVDAFAGTGYRDIPIDDSIGQGLFANSDIYQDGEAKALQEGSAAQALNIDKPFNHYIFIENNPNHAEGLYRLKESSPIADRIVVEQAEANLFLQHWCSEMNWKGNRAVLFLDPYGLEVKWRTLECIAATKAIDVFILFPLGQAVNRLLTRDALPNPHHAKILTELFGTDSWQEAFYKKSTQVGLFESRDKVVKQANFDAIGKYFIERLKTIFPHVSKNRKTLKNSKNVPLFLLCFAASNEGSGGQVAVKIANDILLKDM